MTLPPLAANPKRDQPRRRDSLIPIRGLTQRMDLHELRWEGRYSRVVNLFCIEGLRWIGESA
jgi:hypothetical protein